MDISVVKNKDGDFDVSVGCQRGTIAEADRLALINALQNPKVAKEHAFWVFDGSSWYGPYDTLTARPDEEGRRVVNGTSAKRPNAFGRNGVMVDWTNTPGHITYEPINAHEER